MFYVFLIVAGGIAETCFKNDHVLYGATIDMGVSVAIVWFVTHLWMTKTQWNVLALVAGLVALSAAIAAIALFVGGFVAQRPWYESLAALGVFIVSAFVLLYSLTESAFACPQCGRHMTGQPPYLRCLECAASV